VQGVTSWQSATEQAGKHLYLTAGQELLATRRDISEKYPPSRSQTWGKAWESW